ncbi:MAG: YceI family protein [Verrucomicrobiota bacterium]|nr:YceI family protein [Limisphaera sp.]MDW8382222.1 YceI family protein [Verrucomicrobiota bacterium]
MKPGVRFIGIVGCAWLSLAVSGWSAPLAFDFRDPKGVNHVVFHLDAPLESISGTATGISGTVMFDPENPASTRGRIVVSAESLHVPNPIMKEHLHGAQWMDVKRFPEIVFELETLDGIRQEGADLVAKARGRMTIRDVTRSMEVPVRLTYLKDKLGARTHGKMNGDLLVVRARFTLRRSDFNINPGASSDTVADEIQLTLSLAGAAPRP